MTKSRPLITRDEQAIIAELDTRVDQLTAKLNREQNHVVMAPGIAPENCYLLFAFDQIIGWVNASTASQALQLAFYDPFASHFRAVQSTLCRHAQVNEAIDAGQVLRKTRPRDPELIRLKKENTALREQLKQRRRKQS